MEDEPSKSPGRQLPISHASISYLCSQTDIRLAPCSAFQPLHVARSPVGLAAGSQYLFPSIRLEGSRNCCAKLFSCCRRYNNFLASGRSSAYSASKDRFQRVSVLLRFSEYCPYGDPPDDSLRRFFVVVYEVIVFYYLLC